MANLESQLHAAKAFLLTGDDSNLWAKTFKLDLFIDILPGTIIWRNA